MKKTIVVILFTILFSARISYADSVSDNAINFLKSKQDSIGKITSGFSSPSQWASIAFATNDIDISTVKNPTNSLKEFLITDVPTNNTATDWESRLLAIVAIGSDPTNFGGTNYVQKIESFYANGQIGDECALNDDIFALLALIAGDGSTQIKQSELSYLISKQDAGGGFGWSAPGCSYYAPSVDMTAAAIQALKAAQDNGLSDSALNTTITKAKDYLLSNQNGDSGFGYGGSSDADTTGWVLMAFNVLELGDSPQAVAAKNWLIGKQQSDGGFPGWNGSDTSTTAQALVALGGTGWILHVFHSPGTPQPTNPITPTSTPLPTRTPTPTITPSPTPTVTPNPTLTRAPTPTPIYITVTKIVLATSTPTLTSPVLGEHTTSKETVQRNSLYLVGSVISFVGAFVYWLLRL